MHTYYIADLKHWNYLKRLHATFSIDERGAWWPMLLIEAMEKEIRKELGIPHSRIGHPCR